MEHPIQRRDFVTTMALGGLALAAAPSILSGQGAMPAKVKVALIGCGGRGTGALSQFIAACKILGIEPEVVDVILAITLLLVSAPIVARLLFRNSNIKQTQVTQGWGS